MSRARKFAVKHTRAVGLLGAADVVELLVSELVTNAVLHAGTGVALRLLYDEGLLRVEVRDGSSATARQREYGAEAATGRGLGLIEALAVDWGTEVVGDGKIVWFTVGDDVAVNG